MIALAIGGGVVLAVLPVLLSRLAEQMGAERRDAWVAFVSAIGIFAAVWAAWLTGWLGERRRSLSGWDLPVVGWIAALLALAMAIGSVVWLIGGSQLGRLLSIGFLGVLIVSVLAALGIELIGPMLPLDLLPASLRRVTLDVGAGSGLWLAIGLGLTGTIACNTEMRERVAPRVRFLSKHELDFPAAALFALLVAALVVVALSRYGSWVVIGFEGDGVVVEGWAVPFIGPLSLAGLFAMVGGSALILADRRTAGVVVASVGAISVAVPAAVFTAVSGELVDSGAIEWITNRLPIGRGTLVAQVGSEPVTQYVAAVSAGVLQMFLAVRTASRGVTT